jgi:hypothetical protein
VVISGANHSQFGFYGRHPFDGTPTISHANQIARTVDILLAALGQADRAPDAPRVGELASGTSPP